MNYAALALSLTVGLLPIFVILVTYLIIQNHSLQEHLMSFRTDVDTALGEAKAAIDAIPSRIPPPADPATIVPVADQTATLDGIKALTTEANSILPATPTPTPTP